MFLDSAAKIIQEHCETKINMILLIVWLTLMSDVSRHSKSISVLLLLLQDKYIFAIDRSQEGGCQILKLHRGRGESGDGRNMSMSHALVNLIS